MPIPVAERSKGKNTHTAERQTAARDSIRGNKPTALFPRIESQAAGRRALLHSMCVFALRRGSAAGHLLESRVRIPPGASMFVCCQVEVFATGRSLIQRSSTDCGCVTV
jgi:hypothetical protein